MPFHRFAAPLLALALAAAAAATPAPAETPASATPAASTPAAAPPTMPATASAPPVAQAQPWQIAPIHHSEVFAVPLNAGQACPPPAAVGRIQLQVGGIDTGLRAVGCDGGNRQLNFWLRTVALTPGSNVDAAWERMFGSPWAARSEDFVRTLDYSAVLPAAAGDGTLGQSLFDGPIAVKVLSPDLAAIGFALIAAIWLALFFLGRNTGLIRDPGSQPLAQRSYSLARLQMAWWFGIVVGSYIFLWVVTGGQPTLSAQALSLLGISGATGLTSVGLDANKNTVFPPSQGFWRDILTDANGITLYRFQMLVMTVVLGLFFVIEVVTQLAMPDFDGNTLTLLGISAGGYVGFKLPEQHGDGSDPDVPAATAPAEDDPKAGYTEAPMPQGVGTQAAG